MSAAASRNRRLESSCDEMGLRPGQWPPEFSGLVLEEDREDEDEKLVVAAARLEAWAGDDHQSRTTLDRRARLRVGPESEAYGRHARNTQNCA